MIFQVKGRLQEIRQKSQGVSSRGQMAQVSKTQVSKAQVSKAQAAKTKLKVLGIVSDSVPFLDLKKL